MKKILNKKGFTLVELLGVIVILVLIMSLVLPKIIDGVKSKEVEIDNVNKEIIISAAKLYISNDEYSELDYSTYCLPVTDLINKDYLKDVKDVNGNIVNDKLAVKIYYENKFDYDVVSINSCKNNYSIVYNNFDFRDGQEVVYNIGEGENLTTDLSGNEIEALNITMGGKLLNESDYSYTFNDKLTINNVTGNIIITNKEIVNIINPPDLYNNTLVPVIYDGSNWKIVSSANVNNEWYDYKNQKWANAVILNSTVRSTKKIGDTVSVSGTTPDVLQMYVWIPRFSFCRDMELGHYINNIGANTDVLTETESTKKNDIDYPGAMNIKFVDKDVEEYGFGSYKGLIGSGWLTHPAFCLGRIDGSGKCYGTNLSGIWVSKFEMSHSTISNSTSNGLSCTSSSCSSSKYNNITVLPNKISLDNNMLSNYYYAIQSMKKSGNSFGFDSNVVDPHMIKNTEWAAVAYLSQSIYGKYGNKDYSFDFTNGIDHKEIYINNSYTTGHSGGAISGSTNLGDYTYDVNLNGTGASTTGNIYGIYDMSGGINEFVMATFNNTYGGFSTLTSEVLQAIPDKYINRFTNTDILKACDGIGCKGQALNETNTWYKDGSTFKSPFLLRGGEKSGTLSGIFYIGYTNDNNHTGRGTRIVLFSAN